MAVRLLFSASVAAHMLHIRVQLLCARAGCDCACHTYCANLDCIPEDEWYCHSCTEERESTNQGRLTAIIGNQQPGAAAAVTPAPSRTTRRLTRAGADEQGGRRRSTPGEVVDLITPEELPSAAERPRQRLRRLYRYQHTLNHNSFSEFMHFPPWLLEVEQLCLAFHGGLYSSQLLQRIQPQWMSELPLYSGCSYI